MTDSLAWSLVEAAAEAIQDTFGDKVVGYVVDDGGKDPRRVDVSPRGAEDMTAAPVLPATTAPLIRLLGLFEVGDVPAPAPPKVRTAVALLAMRPQTPVRVGDIVRELWDAAVPSSWQQCVQTYIMRARRCPNIGPGGIVTTSTGYMLTFATPDQVDGWRFIRLVDQALRHHAHGDTPLASDTLRAAMSLWRGDPLADVVCGPRLVEWRHQIVDRYRSARQLRFEIALASGGHRDVLDDLRSEWRQVPESEPVASLLMTALFRCQLRGEALEVFRATRVALASELGLDPGPGLARLQQQVLAGDSSLELEMKYGGAPA